MLYEVIDTGNSRSFPGPHALLEKAESRGDAVVIIGDRVGQALQTLAERASRTAVLIELGMESLGVHTGETLGLEGSNVLGFARFRLGSAPPTALIEVVRQPGSSPAALAAAKEIFGSAGLQIAVCGDVDGRIVDRLVRPYYNAALRRLDEGLASAEDLQDANASWMPEGLEQLSLEGAKCLAHTITSAYMNIAR